MAGGKQTRVCALLKKAVIFRILAAVCSGIMLDAASAGLAYWPLAVPAVALYLGAINGLRVKYAVVISAITGCTFWLLHLQWLTLYLGPVPWLALSAVMIVWFCLMGAAISWALSVLQAARKMLFLSKNSGKVLNEPADSSQKTNMLVRIVRSFLTAKPVYIVVQATVVATVWVLRENLQSTLPYGGFSWGRLAATQANNDLLINSAAYLGVSGLSFVLVFAAMVAVAAWTEFSFSSSEYLRAGCALLASIAALAPFAVLPAYTLQTVDNITVAGVQGNSKSGIFDNRDSGQVLADHLAASKQLLADVQQHKKQIDLLVWPENAGEYAALEDPFRFAQIKNIAAELNTILLFGTVIADDKPGQHSNDQNSDVFADKNFYNSSIAIDADGEVLARYDKHWPVPFAEYMPNRQLFRALAPELVDLVVLDYQHGKTETTFALAGQKIGVAICFDITFDRHTKRLLQEGAGVIIAQTNNADFGRTDQSSQQLALTRLQAVASGRALVNVSTVGRSEIILPSGETAAQIAPYSSGYMIAQVPIVQGDTPATILAPYIYTLVLVSVIVVLVVSMKILRAK